MAIKSGRYGQVLYDALGVTPVEIISIKSFTASFKTDKIDVTCFQDVNKVYVPGMKDVSGSFAGFWNSTPGASDIIFEGADAETPGMLKLVPNSTTAEAAFGWSGLAYLDAEIDTAVDGAPAVSSEFMAAGPWAMTGGVLLSSAERDARTREFNERADAARAARGRDTSGPATTGRAGL